MSDNNTTPLNQKIIALLREALLEAEAGHVIGCGIVLVRQKREVTTSFHATTCYHALNSGAARLAARLALLED